MASGRNGNRFRRQGDVIGAMPHNGRGSGTGTHDGPLVSPGMEFALLAAGRKRVLGRNHTVATTATITAASASSIAR